MTPLRIFRILSVDHATDFCSPVRNPQGRFHHGGQPALYAGLSPDAARHSITRYLRPDDGPRILAEMIITSGRFCNLGEDGMAASYGFPVEATRHRWDNDVAAGRRPITWEISDAIRQDGFDGMIYPTRLRPDLRNVVLFRWMDENGPMLNHVSTKRIPSEWLEAAAPPHPR